MAAESGGVIHVKHRPPCREIRIDTAKNKRRYFKQVDVCKAFKDMFYWFLDCHKGPGQVDIF